MAQNVQNVFEPSKPSVVNVKVLEPEFAKIEMKPEVKPEPRPAAKPEVKSWNFFKGDEKPEVEPEVEKTEFSKKDRDSISF